jgi:hypothetical protein
MTIDTRLGIVGCADQSHGKLWAEMLSKPEAAQYHLWPVKLWDADPANAQALAEVTGAAWVRDLAEVGDGVDGILITGLHPERYLEWSRPFLQMGHRVFYDQPLAGSLADAQETIRLARRHGAKISSGSALDNMRAARQVQKQLEEIGPVQVFTVTGPTGSVAENLPQVIDCLVSTLGPGIATVQAVRLVWSDTRLADGPVIVYVEYEEPGPACGLIQLVGPGSDWYGFRLKLFGARDEGKEIVFDVSTDPLFRLMRQFFQTGIEPVPHAVLLEKTAVFYAALQSAEEGGSIMDIPAALSI